MKPSGFKRNVGGGLMEVINMGELKSRYLQQFILVARNG
jgi:hypothetical protein